MYPKGKDFTMVTFQGEGIEVFTGHPTDVCMKKIK